MVKRIIYPPIWLLLGLILIFFCNEYFPGPRFTSLAGQFSGGVLIIIGLLLLVSANGLFFRAGTDVIPFRNVTTLVTAGIYRYTRNPMYLAMVAVLLGCAITVGASTTLAIPVLFAVIVHWRFIRPEEAMLQGLFAQEYAVYCQQVRRWV
jgi:protein-S-isoprenylcysteine O-methyltransferase Ste14